MPESYNSWTHSNLIHLNEREVEFYMANKINFKIDMNLNNLYAGMHDVYL